LLDAYALKVLCTSIKYPDLYVLKVVMMCKSLVVMPQPFMNDKEIFKNKCSANNYVYNP